jgi:hypothetical protein
MQSSWGFLVLIVLFWNAMNVGKGSAQTEQVDNRFSQRTTSVSGDAEIRGSHRNHSIILKTTSRLAGAIDSLVWNNKEFLDSYDHGRQLQSAASFDCQQRATFWPESFNPTEAGSRADGRGAISSSRLLEISVKGNQLRTVNQPAFWLAPNEMSFGHPALNQTMLSPFRIEKLVTIGIQIQHHSFPNVIEYVVTFVVPEGEKHSLAQFEAVTGYMPFEFDQFYFLNPSRPELKELDRGPGEQEYPIVFSNFEGSHAMGILCPDQPGQMYQGPTYGRFHFEKERVVKWNCVFRRASETFVTSGRHSFRMLIPIGTCDDVVETMKQILELSTSGLSSPP